MQYSQIRAFHYVATCRGFSRAAEALSLTQPAVSEQVRKLEMDHDVLLFNRGRKQITLTHTGEQLLLYTKQLFEVEEQINEMLSEKRAALHGTLRIIADSAYHLAELLKQFRRLHPNVFVTISAGNTSEILKALRNYNAEIGVIGSLNPGPDMEAVNLGNSAIIAFAAKSLLPNPPVSMTLSDLRQHSLVFREKGSRTRQKLEEECQRQRIELKPALEVEGREAVQELVAGGAGIGFVSDAEFGRDSRLVKIPLDCPEMRMDESIVHLKQRSDVRLIRAFMNIEKTF